MKLFLSGGGSGSDSIHLDQKYIQALNSNKPVLYIPIAIDTQRHPYQECLKWIRGQFQPLGFDNFIMWTENELRGKNLKDFEQFGGIYIGGGNTFKLLKELKEFGTFEILKNLAQKDVPIYGGSAGAIILARTIIPALSADSNDVKITDFSALDLLRGYDIWCHYKDVMDEKIYKYTSEHNLKKIISIPESAGLYVTENTIEAVGPSEIFVFMSGVKRNVRPSKNI